MDEAVDPAAPLVEGLRLIEQVDDAGTGELWRARVTGGIAGQRGDRLPGELPGVGECVLRLLRLPVDDALRGRAQVLANDLLTLDDAGLVRVRAVQPAYDGIVLILDPPSPALPLHLLARRRQLSAGEVVTLGVAIGWALAAAHGAGLTHGRLRDADVLLDAYGRPVLAGVGVMGVLGSPGEPSDDVRALTRLLASLLDAESHGAPRLRAVLSEHHDVAGELAVHLAEATAAMAIGIADGEPSEVDDGRSRRRPRRRRMLSSGLFAGLLGGRGTGRWRRGGFAIAAGLAILLLAGVVGWVSSPRPTQRSALPPAISGPTSVTAPPTTDWRDVLTRLDVARAAAFAAPGSMPLSGFDALSTAAYRYDSAALATLRERDAHATGLRMVLERVAVRDRTDRAVTLAVTDRRPAYQLSDGSGQVLSRVAGRGSAQHVIELRATGPPDQPQWRIAQVTDPS